MHYKSLLCFAGKTSQEKVWPLKIQHCQKQNIQMLSLCCHIRNYYYIESLNEAQPGVLISTFQTKHLERILSEETILNFFSPCSLF